ncbi:VOC family protein [Roseomonas aerophila]|uniref:VOC family protein n=1 Tax=Teichococcus aerophilus TaxID=1224513 RepID=A0ABR7RL11_9PROT|nr:VOC family protein [Pseudoroseomonas aerophila]MBC9207275.1 VOC family protein [Pseudoroseomonas aerophila]
MEQRLSLVTLAVADLARATAFYEALGWQRGMRQAEGVSFFQAGGVIVSLYPRADLAADSGVAPAGSGFGGIVLAYNTRDKAEVDSVLAEVSQAGGRVTKPASDAFWGGYTGCFADLDGHLWEVAWNPDFSIAPDGAVTLPG